MPHSKAAFRLFGPRLEERIPDAKPPLTPTQALAEANRCLYCYDAPCVAACPTEINIPEFIKRIGSDNLAGAAQTIFASNILGHSCAQVCPVEVLCAGSCVYNQLEEPPIMIGRLQRYATEHAYERDLHFFEKGPSNGKRVALVGAGPASLACAHELTVLGYEAVLFEGRSLPGGLNVTGVAPYKLDVPEALKEVAYVQSIGFEIRTGVEIGRDVAFAQLLAEYDAVFLGVGLGPDSRLSLPNEDVPGCEGAVAFIERMKTEAGASLDGIERAVVIGGGNTAIDAVRELKALGVPHVTMVYRRTEAQMTGYEHELAHARLEGVEFCFLAVPVALEGDGQVEGLRCRRVTLGAPDANGRAALVDVPDSDFVLPAQLVLKAAGQEKLTALLSALPGVEVQKGRVVVDPASMRTGHPQLFAGGDCANGGKEVVNAAAEGKRAAHGIHAALLGEGAGPHELQVRIGERPARSVVPGAPTPPSAPGAHAPQ